MVVSRALTWCRWVTQHSILSSTRLYVLYGEQHWLGAADWSHNILYCLRVYMFYIWTALTWCRMVTQHSILSSTSLYVLYMSSTDLVQIGHTTFYTVFYEVKCSLWWAEHWLGADGSHNILYCLLRGYMFSMVSSTDLVQQIGHTTFYTVFYEVKCSLWWALTWCRLVTQHSILSSTRLYVLYMVSSTDLVEIGHITFYTVFYEVICFIWWGLT